MMQAPAFLKKKVAGLPLGVWLIIVGAGVGLGLYLRTRNAEDGTEEGEQPGDLYGTEDPYYEGYDTVPMSSLPSEDYGTYPITGGGAPVVPQELALRLQPDTLRIKLIRRKKRERNNKRQGDRGGAGGRNTGNYPPPGNRNRRRRRRQRQSGR